MLSNAEWLGSLPGSDQQKMFMIQCVGCHTLQRVLTSTHTAEEYQQVFKRMGTYSPGSSPARPQPLLPGPRCERPQVGHVAFHRVDPQPLAVGDEPVLGELAGRVVEHGNASPRRREDRPLLSAAGRKAQHLQPHQRRKPRRGDGPGWREDDVPLAPPRRGDLVGGDGDGPAVAFFDLPIPGVAVVLADVHERIPAARR